MVSFKYKFTKGLQERGIEVCHDLADTPYDAVLVIGGTRQVGALFQVRRRGVPVIQRLNGMNWLHRRLPTGLTHYLRAEYGNLLLSFTRRRLATRIVYQSEFAQEWWERVYGPTTVHNRVVYNGIDTKTFTPDGPHHRQVSPFRILMVEGSLGGGYEVGLESAVQLVSLVEKEHGLPTELMVVGNVSEKIKREVEARAGVQVVWSGLVPYESIPEIDRSAHLLYSADLNAACPNSVIEALACGLPVVAFDTGALPELVTGDAGRVVPYGGDPWTLTPPDTPALAQAAAEILIDQHRFRLAARSRAENLFNLEGMVEGYLEVLLRDA
jgi:glycosyltransferase involved in cell wall biosynthesis